MNTHIPLDWQINDRYSGDDQRAALAPLLTALDSTDTDQIYRQMDKRTKLGFQPAPPDLGFELSADDFLIYPGLPPLAPIAYAVHLGERVLVYPYGFLLVVQLNGDFSLTRYAT